MKPERRPFYRRIWTRRLELPLLAEAILALITAKLSLKLRPFHHIVRGLTQPNVAIVAESPETQARRVRWAVLVAAGHMPWRSVCFDQAIAVHRMLRRRGVFAEVIYGVRHQDQDLNAHVWVCLADGSIVIGGEQAPNYRPIARFRAGTGGDAGDGGIHRQA